MSAAEQSSTPTKSYLTPTKRALFNAEAGPSRKPQGASPAYSSRRHSLYGIEDRIVIDPGSRIWKVGFSGEADPRAVFWANEDGLHGEMWDLDLGRMGCIDRKEASRLVGSRITSKMREVFIKHLMTDPKSRKVIVLENTFLPSFVKEHIAEALFENLKVPSLSFTSSALLSLTACGRITGLVVDVGWLETTITPVYYSRPLFHLSRSTAIAGRQLHRRLRALIERFATYYHPPASLNNLTRQPISPVRGAIVTDRIIERIVTEVCFVSGVMASSRDTDESMDMDIPEGEEENRQMDGLKRLYEAHSTATALSFPIPVKDSTMGPGTLVVPGWIRERAAEVLFEDDSSEENDSIQEVVLQSLLHLPTDLRSTLAGAILVTGGTASLPGFIPRLRISLRSALLPPPTSAAPSDVSSAPLNTPQHRLQDTQQWRKRGEEPYRELYGLVNKIAILNDPAPIDAEEGGSNAGKAPRWVPSLMSWVGGSLAGMLKTGAPEILREEYDTQLGESITRGEAYVAEQEAAEVELAALVGIELEELRPGQALINGDRRRGWKEGVVLKDWARSVPVT